MQLSRKSLRFSRSRYFMDDHADEIKRREISLYAGRPFRRGETGGKNRPVPFEMTVGGPACRGERIGVTCLS